jgi:hypothetical protein
MHFMTEMPLWGFAARHHMFGDSLEENTLDRVENAVKQIRHAQRIGNDPRRLYADFNINRREARDTAVGARYQRRHAAIGGMACPRPWKGAAVDLVRYAREFRPDPGVAMLISRRRAGAAAGRRSGFTADMIGARAKPSATCSSTWWTADPTTPQMR